MSVTSAKQYPSYPPGVSGAESMYATQPSFTSTQMQHWSAGEAPTRRPPHFQDMTQPSPWSSSPIASQYAAAAQVPMSPGEPPRAGYSGVESNWPGPLLRRSSSENARLNQLAGSYYGEGSSSTSSLHGKAYPQRRPSNRDEFDGPSQLLEKPMDADYEPKEEDLPSLPVTLQAQEQDEILSKVNERLSHCAFDFVAKYQFPIPIEPDKRPVRVPGDREWSEWVYLLKRLATKRRIPSRVLFGGQIKQLMVSLSSEIT